MLFDSSVAWKLHSAAHVVRLGGTIVPGVLASPCSLLNNEQLFDRCLDRNVEREGSPLACRSLGNAMPKYFQLLLQLAILAAGTSGIIAFHPRLTRRGILLWQVQYGRLAATGGDVVTKMTNASFVEPWAHLRCMAVFLLVLCCCTASLDAGAVEPR